MKAPQLNINAGLFYAASLFTSKEDARYYLQGVFVEPHPIEGITLTATDGVRLACIYDRSGSIDRQSIIEIDKKGLSQFKPKLKTAWSKLSSTDPVMDGSSKFRVELLDKSERFISGIPAEIIDAAFPNYRAIVAAFKASISPRGEMAVRPDQLATFGEASESIKLAFGFNGALGVGIALAENPRAPALISFGIANEGFGLIMPVERECLLIPPSWFAPNSPEEKAA